jgi:hypothetical protein
VEGFFFDFFGYASVMFFDCFTLVQMLVRINFEQEIIQILACFFDDTVQRVTVLGIFYQMTE